MKLDGSKVKAGRLALRIPMTAAELAAVVQLTPRMINMIENGKATKRKTAERIAKAIKVPLAELIYREVV